MAIDRQMFADAIAVRNKVTAKQEKEIRKLYKRWARDIGKQVKYYKRYNTSSSIVKERQMKELKKSLEQASGHVTGKLLNIIERNAFIVTEATIGCSTKWLAKLGIVVPKGFKVTNLEYRVVRNILNGQVYIKGWSLSKAIWGDNNKTLRDISKFLARGVAENKPIYEIAKDIERYVNPSKAKPWNKRLKFSSDSPKKGFTFNPKTGKYEQWKKLYKAKVDYNAQRLGRTIVQHSYQQAFVEGTKNNPFILKYLWVANGSRTCPLCEERDGQLFEKDELPLDHPNGQCTIEPYLDDNWENKLNDWLDSPEGTYPDIDEFVKEF